MEKAWNFWKRLMLIKGPSFLDKKNVVEIETAFQNENDSKTMIEIFRNLKVNPRLSLAWKSLCYW